MPRAYIACTLLSEAALFSVANARAVGMAAGSAAVEDAFCDVLLLLLLLLLLPLLLLLLPKVVNVAGYWRSLTAAFPFPFPLLATVDVGSGGDGVAAIFANFAKERSKRFAYLTGMWYDVNL